MNQLRSGRLDALRILAGSGSVAADIGCDHAYLSIALVESGAYKRVIAGDLREGPLKAAKEHVLSAGLQERIELRRSDGLSGLTEGEADTLILAGMGGALMLRILQEGDAVARAADRLVLQPQSELREFRQWLREHAYRILSEDMVCEDGKYYPMMAVTPEKEKAMPDPAGCIAAGPSDPQGDTGTITKELADAYGGLLLAGRHPVLGAYLKEAQVQNEKLLKALHSADAEGAGEASEGKKERREARIRELEEEKKRIMEALWFYRN